MKGIITVSPDSTTRMPNLQGQVGFGPWSFFKRDTTLHVDRSFIVYIMEREILENYEKIFNPDKIQTPSKKLIFDGT